LLIVDLRQDLDDPDDCIISRFLTIEATESLRKYVSLAIPSSRAAEYRNLRLHSALRILKGSAAQGRATQEEGGLREVRLREKELATSDYA
jgi:hypothetical protein